MIICFIGSGSTGKTTLGKALELKTGIKYVESPTRNVSAVLQDVTAEGQRECITNYYDEYRSHSKPVIFSRTIFDVIAYAMAYDVWSMDEATYRIKHYIKSEFYPDYIFYLPIEFDAVKDGVRDVFLDKQKDVDGFIQAILTQCKIDYHLISGSVDERINKILEVLKPLN